MKSLKLRISIGIVSWMVLALAAQAQQYVLVGWNDLGMHCSNKDFSKIVVLPPYNNVRAQLIRKQEGSGSQVLTAGYTVSYSIPGNTFSVGKTNFWQYAQTLFGLSAPLPPNIGLTGNGLSGAMAISGNAFIATGIPVTPFQDSNLVKEKPYQLIHLVARAINSNTVLATTDVVIPVSNEIGCLNSGCHASEQAILNKHSSVNGMFNRNGPVLCASCHASNALGTTGMASAKSLSFRLHDKHSSILDKRGTTTSSKLAVCYNCHPGTNTKCLRDVMLNDARQVCQDCHGTMKTVAATISAGRRPWLDEPKCATCHKSTFGEEPGKLYRESKGHGNLYCSACHGSPHAIYPTSQPNDNLQNIRLQGEAGTLEKCTVCHATTPSGRGPHGMSPKLAGEIENPAGFELGQMYPNPVGPATLPNVAMWYTLPQDAFVTLQIFDSMGRKVATVLEAEQATGRHSANCDLTTLTAGMYFYTLQAGGMTATKKFVILR